ncbi:hypothetical protein D3C84_1053720 [compost metagenome]
MQALHADLHADHDEGDDDGCYRDAAEDGRHGHEQGGDQIQGQGHQEEGGRPGQVAQPTDAPRHAEDLQFGVWR